MEYIAWRPRFSMQFLIISDHCWMLCRIHTQPSPWHLCLHFGHLFKDIRVCVSNYLYTSFVSMTSADIHDDDSSWSCFDLQFYGWQVVGRIASQIAVVLQGKDKPTYTPNKEEGDICIVVNARHVALTGNKITDKFYKWHTGWVTRSCCSFTISIYTKKLSSNISKAVKHHVSSPDLVSVHYLCLRLFIYMCSLLISKVYVLFGSLCVNNHHYVVAIHAYVCLFGLIPSYVGGLKQRNVKDQMKWESTEVLRTAVHRMLPKNKLQDVRACCYILPPFSSLSASFSPGIKSWLTAFDVR